MHYHLALTLLIHRVMSSKQTHRDQTQAIVYSNTRAQPPTTNEQRVN